MTNGNLYFSVACHFFLLLFVGEKCLADVCACCFDCSCDLYPVLLNSFVFKTNKIGKATEVAIFCPLYRIESLNPNAWFKVCISHPRSSLPFTLCFCDWFVAVVCLFLFQGHTFKLTTQLTKDLSMEMKGVGEGFK